MLLTSRLLLQRKLRRTQFYPLGLFKQVFRVVTPQIPEEPKFKKKFIDNKKAGGVPEWVLNTTDPNAMIPAPFIDQLAIIVSGGPGEKTMLIPVGGSYKKLLSKEVKLPANWEKLLQERE